MHILKRFNYVVKRNPFLFPLLSHMSAVHNIMPPYFIQICFNICPESHRPFKWTVPFMFSYHKSVWFCHLPCVLCVSPISTSFIWTSCYFLKYQCSVIKNIENTATAQRLKWRQIAFLMRLWSNKVSFLRTTGDVVWQFKFCGLFTPNFIFKLWIFWHVAWFRLLVAGLPLQRSGFDPNHFVWDLWWTEWHWDILFSEYFSCPSPYHSANSSLSHCTYPDVWQELLNTKLNVLCIFLETEGWEEVYILGVTQYLIFILLTLKS